MSNPFYIDPFVATLVDPDRDTVEIRVTIQSALEAFRESVEDLAWQARDPVTGEWPAGFGSTTSDDRDELVYATFGNLSE